MNQTQAMDRIYRYQRHFYDVSRPLFLPGRDALLRAMAPRPKERILEMGCGTARNLIYLAQCSDDVLFFGVDASLQMLKTAFRKVRQARCEDRICLRHGAAETVDPFDTFSLTGKFDRIFFSYSLSMMPAWLAALDAAKAALSPSGSLWVVDFWDLSRWPKPMGFCISAWLSLFHVRFEKEMPDEICRRFPNTEIHPLWKRYAFLARPHAI